MPVGTYAFRGDPAKLFGIGPWTLPRMWDSDVLFLFLVKICWGLSLLEVSASEIDEKAKAMRLRDGRETVSV